MNQENKLVNASKVMIKTSPQLDWPEGERLFYVLGRDGLFICRNHPFFKSCVPAREWPSNLERQGSFYTPAYPPIPKRLFERVVGFFDQIGELHGAEASVLLYWDPEENRVEGVVPEQTATVVRYRDGYQHPIGLSYLPPGDLPRHWVPFGDIHSHVRLAAYSSETDKEDEAYSAGLHIVVGRIHLDPPDVHIEAVVDGRRFGLAASDVLEGYEARDVDVPAEWLDRVEIDVNPSWGWPSVDASSNGSFRPEDLTSGSGSERGGSSS